MCPDSAIRIAQKKLIHRSEKFEENHNEMKHLAIIGYGASGSSALFDQLWNNKNIAPRTIKEPLSPVFMDKYPPGGKYHWFHDYLSRMADDAQAGGKILAVHIKPQHIKNLNISFDNAVEILSERFDFIVLRRRNVLARMTSGRFKKLRNSPEHGGIRLPNKILARLEEFETVENEIMEAVKDRNFVFVEYETDLLPSVRGAADKICKHFNIYHDYVYERKLFTYHAQKNKWSSLRLSEKIANYEEIKTILTDTRFEWMLDG